MNGSLDIRLTEVESVEDVEMTEDVDETVVEEATDEAEADDAEEAEESEAFAGTFAVVVALAGVVVATLGGVRRVTFAGAVVAATKSCNCSSQT